MGGGGFKQVCLPIWTRLSRFVLCSVLWYFVKWSFSFPLSWPIDRLVRGPTRTSVRDIMRNFPKIAKTCGLEPLGLRSLKVAIVVAMLWCTQGVCHSYDVFLGAR